jgi:hypothetical protein
MDDEPFDHDALVIKTNAILEEVERMRKEWERSNPSIESVNQMRIAANESHGPRLRAMNRTALGKSC